MMIVEINICNYIPEAYIAFGIVPVEMQTFLMIIVIDV
jgi:hypothetical protein